MTTPATHPVEGIDLSLIEFWQQPLEARHADFARLRALAKPPYFIVPEGPFSTPGDGYRAGHAAQVDDRASEACRR